MKIHHIDTNKRLSTAVSFDNFVFLSGQVPTTLDGDFETQTKEVLEKIDCLLDKAGSNKSYILSAQIWIKNIEKDFDAFNKLWEAWLPDDCAPARAAVEANLARPNVLVEVALIAAKR